MAERRSAHPYYLYDAIQAQPALIEKMFTRRASIERAPTPSRKRRGSFSSASAHRCTPRKSPKAGCANSPRGASWSAASNRSSWCTIPSRSTRDDAVVVITHTGTTTYSIEALRAALAAGALTIAITGEMSGEGVRGADFQIETCEQEISFAYTKSYTTALAAIALLLIARRRPAQAAAGRDAARGHRARPRT